MQLMARHFWQVLFMAGPGVLVGTCLIAGFCKALLPYNWDWPTCLVFGAILGKNAVAGLLSGALVSGVQLAISMSNSGGAWDNAKKYIEAGGLGPGKGKKSGPHKNAVIGDTVGDPLKDTSGPALNIVMKLCAIMSLVFGSVIADYSNPAGGPKWLKAA